MFNLSVQDVHLAATADSKDEAIKQVATALAEAGYVKEGYVLGMLARENQAPTFLGNGIAIPHGTTQTRDQVIKTGVAVFQFPQGVDWGDEQIAYIVIGIAALSNEHLALLRQLTHIISDEAVAQAMAKADSAELLRRLLMGEETIKPLKFDGVMVTLNTEANSLNSLQVLNLAHLQEHQVINAEFITHVLTQSPHYLGEGIWLSDSPVGNLHSAITLVTTKSSLSYQGKPVKMLITLSYADEQVAPFLANLNQLLQHQQIETLLKVTDADALASLLAGSELLETETAEGITEEFVIRNPHGLHTRPSTILVNTIKKYDSNVTVANLDGSATPVNGRSLMKVVSLGAKKGHRLRINAQGADAVEAMSAIAQAINDGLGEEVA
ncbi:fused PTS fructose transporter subunit IIA/HPr protein [Providencia rettgeri]|uniref:fused PTS fructose transporter subunit IIA/HPr protein n=1 Tax=Providencia rettgeri TaxID=587 RepID=UPI0034E075D5